MKSLKFEMEIEIEIEIGNEFEMVKWKLDDLRVGWDWDEIEI